MTDRATNVVMSFDIRISRQDRGGLPRLMTHDHVFIDAAGNTIAGKARSKGEPRSARPARLGGYGSSFSATRGPGNFPAKSPVLGRSEFGSSCFTARVATGL
jgi:hypothetical protein